MAHHESELLSKLSTLLKQETKLVKAGDFTASSLLQTEKNRLIEEFQTTVAAMNEAEKADVAEQLKQLSDLLNENMAALSIAKDVSADIIKRVADVVNGPRRTSAYGSNALKPNSPPPAMRGIAVDKGF